MHASVSWKSRKACKFPHVQWQIFGPTIVGLSQFADNLSDSALDGAGVQIAKMSPFRSYAVTTASALTASVAFSLGLGGGATTYINVSWLMYVVVWLAECTTFIL